uniref:Collagen, type XII, alpha 1a n=1 Tax=Astyanax mexicanus TaxID=7994 RepID=A0A8B9LB67_ASTMX
GCVFLSRGRRTSVDPLSYRCLQRSGNAVQTGECAVTNEEWFSSHDEESTLISTDLMICLALLLPVNNKSVTAALFISILTYFYFNSACSDVVCKTTAQADIVLLVDGSWSIGRLNFKTIRAFIARMVGVFDIGPDRVQIGLAQYSGDPKTEWHLNAHRTRDSLLEAVANLPYKGGNTLTGLALNYILQNNFKANVGMRPNSRKIGVLVTDGKSQDDIIANSQNLRDQGIELYAIGVKNADENELRSIASDPDEIHMYNVADFSFLLDIVDDLTDNLCKRVASPTDLVTSEVTYFSFRATWTGPEGPVEKYRVEYVPVAGGETQQLFVDGAVTTVVLEGLDPLTEYSVSVFSVVGEESSEPLLGAETTPKITDVQLKELIPNTAYTITVYTLRGTATSDPLTDQGVTLPLPPAGELRIRDVTHSSMMLHWDAAPGLVRKYTITYKPQEGELKEVVISTPLKKMSFLCIYIFSLSAKELPSKQWLLWLRGVLNHAYDYQYKLVYYYSYFSLQVLVPGNTNTALLEQLLSNTDYNVGVVAIYSDGEGAAVKDNGKTLPRSGPRNMRVYDPTTNTLTVSWEHAAGPVQQYRISYAPTTGDPIEEFTSVPGNRNNVILQNLQPETPYLINVVAMYPDGAGGELSGDGQTLGLLGPRNLRVSDEWYTRFRVSWDAAPARVNGYKLAYAVEGELNLVHVLMYLNVTDLVTYNVGYDSFCIKWTPHRAATSYRLKVNPFIRNGAQEVTITAAESQYCFDGLTPDALYNATVYTQTPNQEGPGVSVKERTLVKPTVAPTLPPTPPPPPTIPVCKGAKADLVFLIDGSWSIGDESFSKVLQFVFSMIGAFDVVSHEGMQVSFVQYSDDAKTEFKLNTYHDKGMALSAVRMINYRGGNTKTGAALKHVGEKVFTSDSGMRRNVPKVLVVVTDGRAQDDVKKSASKLQHSGYSVFVVGVADVDLVELRNIGSKPSERHVFIVDDYDAFAKIQDNLITFICETATSTCPLIYLDGFTSPGFRMLEAFNITDRTFAGMNGVSMESGSFNSFITYRLHKDSFISQPTKEIHPDGLPPSYTLILLFRLLPDTTKDAFDLWQISDKNDNPEVGLTLNPSSRTITFYNKDTRGEIQKVTFDNNHVKKIFHGSFHKLHISISPKNVKLNIDCQEVAEKPIKEANNITTDGYEVLGKMAKSGGGKKQSATFQLQMFDIVCSLGWTSRDKCSIWKPFLSPAHHFLVHGTSLWNIMHFDCWSA